MTVSHQQQVAALRAFNRDYTARIGLLNAHLDKSPFSLSEARVLYELANRADPTAAEIGRALGLDRGQLSRTLKRFISRGFVDARTEPNDARHMLLSLTSAGREAFAALEGNTSKAIGDLLNELSPARRSRLIAATQDITTIFQSAQASDTTLRTPRPGDLGWVIHRQATLYTKEYGWNGEYEALITKIIAEFQQAFDPGKEAVWIAEMDGEIVGSIFLVKGDQPNVAKLRLLYVEPEARGTGVARKLVETCVARARENGYERLDLWTNSVLTAARKLYEKVGFKLVHEAPHHSFGKDLIGQTWSLDL